MSSLFKCGTQFWHPKWMQKFASAKAFISVYGVLGTVQAMATVYFLVTLTTLEKQFKIPSHMLGE
jgi:solute carrier organic anion transporter family, member 5A